MPTPRRSRAAGIAPAISASSTRTASLYRGRPRRRHDHQRRREHLSRGSRGRPGPQSNSWRAARWSACRTSGSAPRSSPSSSRPSPDVRRAARRGLPAAAASPVSSGREEYVFVKVHPPLRVRQAPAPEAAQSENSNGNREYQPTRKVNEVRAMSKDYAEQRAVDPAGPRWPALRGRRHAEDRHALARPAAAQRRFLSRPQPDQRHHGGVRPGPRTCASW